MQKQKEEYKQAAKASQVSKTWEAFSTQATSINHQLRRLEIAVLVGCFQKINAFGQCWVKAKTRGAGLRIPFPALEQLAAHIEQLQVERLGCRGFYFEVNRVAYPHGVGGHLHQKSFVAHF